MLAAARSAISRMEPDGSRIVGAKPSSVDLGPDSVASSPTTLTLVWSWVGDWLVQVQVGA